MKKFKTFLCAVIVSLIAASTFANDYVKFKGWKQAETTHFRFIYEAASEPAAKAYAKIADQAWEKIARIYSMPQEKTNVYVFSRLNIVNAYTFFSPPEIVMFDSPLLYNTFGFREDWMELFFTHELIHVANITFEDKKYLTSKLMGETFRGMDYSMIPGWALEGLTTVLETELTDGGRGRSPYFELDFKAPTMDNNLIPYRLIGTEEEPPYGQIYVMGYLIMRSIADRWGIQALADIERNRSFDRTWEESVKLVTGKTPQDIYREVKIALEKKYAGERQIPEGKIISPNDVNISYHRPAIVFDDGSLITIRSERGSDAYAVLLNPAAKEGLDYYVSEKEAEDSQSKGQIRETILFTADFSDETALAADENKTVYFTSAVSRYDRNPGTETIFPIFKWTKEDGIKRLTLDESSYYQPAVSRDGKILVAVEQSGLKMHLVQIDTETGDKTVIFEDSRYSFIQPALNQDGSQIAFLLLKDDRACVALGDISTKQYKIVNNTDFDFITDPSTPGFDKDGNLIFCSNDRGRLEIYEAKINSDGQTFTYEPMLSDPIAALWSYKNDFGIFYLSQASTGDVIKIKPVEEWGKVPDFEGPSTPGEIMTFGDLEDDYPEFTPYKEMAEKLKKEDKAREAEESSKKLFKTKESENKEEDEDYKHRSAEKIAQLDKLEPGTTELSNEKTYIPKIASIFYMPFIDGISDKDNSYLGIGGIYYGQFPRLQMKNGILWLDAFYYPKLNNFTGEFLAEIPVGTSTIDLFIQRDQSQLGLSNDKSNFIMNNRFFAGYTLPIISREEKLKATSLNFITYAGASLVQQNDKAFSLTDKIPFSKNLSFHTGLDYSQQINLLKDSYLTFSVVNLALGNYDIDTKKFGLGYEGEVFVQTGNSSSKQEISLVMRYTDFASKTIPEFSRAHFAGHQENCLFPGKIVLGYTYIMPGFVFGAADLNLFAQGMASFGKNSDGQTPDTKLPLNFNLEQKINIGAEIGLPLSLGQKLAVGYSALIELKEGDVSTPDTKFYVTIKMNWLRY